MTSSTDPMLREEVDRKVSDDAMQFAGPNPDPLPLKCDRTLSSADVGRDEKSPTPVAIPSAVGPPPDGGRDAWLVVLGGFLLMYVSFGFITSFGQFQSYYLANQLSTYSKSTVAWIGSIQLFVTFALSLPAGRWFDAHGMRGPAISGTVCFTGSLIAVAFCKEFYQFLLAHLLYGFGCASVFAPTVALAGHWFAKRRSTAMGIIVAGTGIGGVVYPIMLSRLLAVLSFRDTLLIMASMNFCLTFPTIFIARGRLPPKILPPWRIVKEPFKDRAYAFLDLGTSIVAINLFSPFIYAPLLAATNSLPPSLASYAVAILQAGSTTGRVSAGLFADRLGVWRTYLGAAIGAVISLAAFWIGDTGTAGTVIGLWAYGHFSGMWITMIGGCCASVTAASGKVDQLGLRLGLLFGVMAVPNLLGPVICGYIINATPGGRFTYSGIFAVCTMALGSCITLSPWLMGLWRRRKGS
ncbi:putative transporter [Dioszegia hungarica]|uniref:Transporter n=1 Tax=Dioszegia hungarica TaxID=4972 RepID=A0AA38LSP8_9TREE|nr:putative transporter [Dioszegia hungarica]KAI9632849.1 putative transporter [Dioszegia hungarica]